jgi:hypothetical protein
LLTIVVIHPSLSANSGLASFTEESASAFGSHRKQTDKPSKSETKKWIG